jgi:hypothetical protein
MARRETGSFTQRPDRNGTPKLYHYRRGITLRTNSAAALRSAETQAFVRLGFAVPAVVDGKLGLIPRTCSRQVVEVARAASAGRLTPV